MKKIFVATAIALAVLPPVASTGEEGKEEKKKDIRLWIHAKKTKKLGAGLHAVQMSGGTLIGMTPRGGVVVEVNADTVEAAEKRLTAGNAKVTREKLPKTEAVNRLILTYKKDAKVTVAIL